MNTDLKPAETRNAPASPAMPLRKTMQHLMPARINQPSIADTTYTIYPFHSFEAGAIFNGFTSLAQWIASEGTVVIDGYAGLFWKTIKTELHSAFSASGLTVNWIETAHFLKPAIEIEAMVQPFLGDHDSVWGYKCSLDLEDFYDTKKLAQQVPDSNCTINIIIGTGAALSTWKVPVVYIDLPKNELQFRMRAGAIFNLGSDAVFEPAYMYKRFYFVDWVLLNKHKKKIAGHISVIADGQWPDTINWMVGKNLHEGLKKISRSVFRVRPWFEPGAWGGQWLKNHMPLLNPNVRNYAWSFELIVPENGLVFESDGFLVEVSFDFLMFQQNEAVLGRHADTFGDEFPIRFDFLDTIGGGNLSIQCHPSVPYIQQHFGETITQDETYYILDCEANATVYLGFQEGINANAFKTALEASQVQNVAVEIEKYVQAHPAQKGDLFLIPNQTIHSAGAGNLVLEISATPYIFTFKMYDWLRLDLDGKPRPINIEHAFNNLDFERQGKRVQQELISKPVLLIQEPGWQLFHLPTHANHFYDVHRIEFDGTVSVETNDSCHVLMLVEGEAVQIKTFDGTTQEFAFAETFVVPAAACSYQLTNKGSKRAKVIKAFLK